MTWGGERRRSAPPRPLTIFIFFLRFVWPPTVEGMSTAKGYLPKCSQVNSCSSGRMADSPPSFKKRSVPSSSSRSAALVIRLLTMSLCRCRFFDGGLILRADAGVAYDVEPCTPIPKNKNKISRIEYQVLSMKQETRREGEEEEDNEEQQQQQQEQQQHQEHWPQATQQRSRPSAASSRSP